MAEHAKQALIEEAEKLDRQCCLDSRNDFQKGFNYVQIPLCKKYQIEV